MNKKIKNIIMATLVIGIFSCILPNDNFTFGSIEAYASTYQSASDGELSSLTLRRSTGSEVKLLDSYYGDEVSLTGRREYYVEFTGSSGFEIYADVKGNGYVIKQFTSDDKTEKGDDVGKYINIDSTSENIYLRTYKSEDSYKEAYDDGNVADCEKTYIIHVKKPPVMSFEEANRNYAYLQNIYISNGDIDFSKKQYSYNINVDEDVKEILIRATPEYNNNSVEINGQYVDGNDNYEKTLNLDKGNNTIEVYVENDDENETYTLNIYRGKSADLSTLTIKKSTSITSNTHKLMVQSDIKKFNAWKIVDGKWKYIDGTGEILKNQWWFDKNIEKSYYLKEDGYMATGWLYSNNSWYYFNANGEMQNGWMFLDGNWYYLNKSGVMQTGWIKDSAENWYYLDSKGKMI